MCVCPLQEGCSPSALCPIAAASTSYCGSCDLDPSEAVCTWVRDARTPSHTSTYAALHTPTHNTAHNTLYTTSAARSLLTADTHQNTPLAQQSDPALCPSHDDVVYSGGANRYSYTGMSAHAHTHIHAHTHTLLPRLSYEFYFQAWTSAVIDGSQFGWR